jgi:hypothetical protein
MKDALLLAIGETDCEAIGEGLLAQPVNAVTSIAYIAAGLTLMARGARVRRPEGTGALLFDATLVAVGLGAVAFHGPQSAASQFLHDVPIVALLLLMCLRNAARLGWPRPVAKLYGLALPPITGVLAVVPTLTPVMTGVLAAGAVGGEILLHRSQAGGRSRHPTSVAAVLAALAAVAYILGRTDSVICRPESIWQFHGLWHVLSAAALAGWGLAAYGPSTGHGPR